VKIGTGLFRPGFCIQTHRELFMTKTPPVPPENRSPKEPPDAHKHAAPDSKAPKERDIDPEKQGQQGNTQQNTTNQGYQQDR